MSMTSDTQVAEIVTFKLNENVAESAFLEDARRTEAVLRETPGFVRRVLSRSAEGDWTDFILWSDMDSALNAAETVVKHPDFAAFGGAIHGPSVAMRHEHVGLEMTP